MTKTTHDHRPHGDGRIRVSDEALTSNLETKPSREQLIIGLLRAHGPNSRELDIEAASLLERTVRERDEARQDAALSHQHTQSLASRLTQAEAEANLGVQRIRDTLYYLKQLATTARTNARACRDIVTFIDTALSGDSSAVETTMNEAEALRRVIDRHVKWREKALGFLKQVIDGRGCEDEWPALTEFIERSETRIEHSAQETSDDPEPVYLTIEDWQLAWDAWKARQPKKTIARPIPDDDPRSFAGAACIDAAARADKTPLTLSPDGMQLGRWKLLDIHADDAEKYCVCGRSQLEKGQKGYYCTGCGKDLHPDNYLPENGKGDV